MTRQNAPWESNEIDIEEGIYTVVIRVHEGNEINTPICDEIALTFNVVDDFELTFEDDAVDFGVNVDDGKDGGLAFGDYDNDGDLDLLVNTDDNSTRSRIYRNNGDNTFTDVTSLIAPYMLSTTRERVAVWGDLNNDGWLDYMRNTSFAGIEVYIQETGGGIFGDGVGGTTPLIFDASNVANGVNTEGAGFVDFDGDGDLDIIFDNHNYGIDILRNNFVDHSTGVIINPPTSGLFTHATPGNTVSLGLAQSATDGDYGSFTDVNDDGWVDIFMRKRDENDFFLNQGGTFINGSDLAQAENNNKGAVNLYDYDNDGDFDAFWTEEGDNQIFRNDNGVWIPLGASTGIPVLHPGNSIDEVVSGDIDNDGDIDILLVGDSISQFYINQLNDPILGRNVGTPMNFVLDASIAFHEGKDGEGASMVDIDNDGDLDVYINVENQENTLYINNLYDSSTPEILKDYLMVRILDDRPAYMQAGQERPAIGATVVLKSCDGIVISGKRELNGGTGHGTQDPPLVHFGLADGPDFSYKVIVKYPNWINPATGLVERKVVSKWIRPSQSATFPVTIEFRPSDANINCPIEICDNGIDDDFDLKIDCQDEDCGGPIDSDGDGVLDFCDIDDDNDGIPDVDEGLTCTSLDLSGYDGMINNVTDFNNANIMIGSSTIHMIDPITFVGGASLDEFGINDDHETGSYGIQLGVVNSTSPSQYMLTQFTYSPAVYNFNARILDVDRSDGLIVTAYHRGIEVPFEIKYLGACVSYDGAQTFTSFCFKNSNPIVGGIAEHAIEISFLNFIDSMTFQSFDTGDGFGGSFTIVPALEPTCALRDSDIDLVYDHLDLDSDNDGLLDLIESGHSGVDANNDGIIDGTAATFGANGLHDSVETSPDSDIINYSISDSESSPDGIYDPYELDSDNDGCFDSIESEIVDLDNDEDGVAGVGSTSVDPNGLVTGTTYTDPINTNWQNSLFNICVGCRTALTNPHIMYFRRH